MGFEDEVYVAHAVAYLNGLKTKAAKEMADGLLRFLNSRFRMVMQMESKWLPIETAPKDGTVIDLWCGEYNERLTNYRRVKLAPDNIFYSPTKSGRSVVRTATHWMPLPEPPGGDDGRG
ncbi:DUF551 domain-containing protein [Xanthomonas sontii]|uniref:DUF551 domain-containing protein n=1 Tax=Xanthomonas sontii TaxID=2650745 RepID=UPI003F85AFE4